MDRKPFPWAVFFIFLLVISLPYLIAWMYSDANVSFNGFLLNPIDGYSYLAKVEQGRSGTWLFQLPFTSDPNSGAPIFLYYLFLGHLARLLGIKALAIIHIARIINAILLFNVLWRACLCFFNKAEKWVVAALTLGGGMGWLILPWVSTPTDFWVAEGYPFLASYTNPHFPLAMALIVITIILWKNNTQNFGLIFSLFSGVLLSIIQPFGVVIVAMTLGMDWIFRIIKQKRILGTGLPNLLAFIGGGLPYSIYLLILINRDPVLAEWNRQNVTPSPEFFDLLVSFSPGLLVIIAGVIYAIKKKIVLEPILVMWVIVTIGLSFIPFNLQRRFLLSGYIPVTLLSISFIYLFLDGLLTIGRLLRKVYLPVVIITPLLILLIASIGISTKNPLIFIYSHQDVSAGADWLKENALKSSTVLSDTKTGLYLPVLANVRVVYGHPFETPHADEKKVAVDRCFSDGDIAVCDQVIQDEDVDYLWVNLENSEKLTKYYEKNRLVFNSHAVSIYEID